MLLVIFLLTGFLQSCFSSNADDRRSNPERYCIPLKELCSNKPLNRGKKRKRLNVWSHSDRPAKIARQDEVIGEKVRREELPVEKEIDTEEEPRKVVIRINHDYYDDETINMIYRAGEISYFANELGGRESVREFLIKFFAKAIFICRDVLFNKSIKYSWDEVSFRTRSGIDVDVVEDLEQFNRDVLVFYDFDDKERREFYNYFEERFFEPILLEKLCIGQMGDKFITLLASCITRFEFGMRASLDIPFVDAKKTEQYWWLRIYKHQNGLPC
ncbi:hypothetical protein HOD08_02915 [bacterium]|mgnify:CR=1 FL=1|nr:hypothetical protein [bacterium]